MIMPKTTTKKQEKKNVNLTSGIQLWSIVDKHFVEKLLIEYHRIKRKKKELQKKTTTVNKNTDTAFTFVRKYVITSLMAISTKNVR